MGGTQAYQSKEAHIQDLIKSKDADEALDKISARRDGTLLPTKKRMCEKYDQSQLPWPLNPLYNLDYCYRLNLLMFKHSFYTAVPLTMVHFIYTQMPDVWKYTRKTFPKLLLCINYVACILVLNAVNVTYSLMFEPYW